MQFDQPLTTTISPSSIDLFAHHVSGDDREKILIVDDSLVVRRSLSKRLAGRFDCHESDSVLDAFDRLKSNDFALVITDIIMPGLSGIELLRRVIESYPRTEVIVVSSVDRPQRALDAVRLGAFDYLIKPWDDDVLDLTVNRAIEHRRLLLDAKQYKADLETRNDELIRGKKQLERLQAQIIQNEKMASIGQLAAGIAHELNNPVGFLYGNLDVLEKSVKDLIRMVRAYDGVALPPDVAAKIDDLKEEISFHHTVADLDSIIADCREGAVRVRDIVQNLRTFSRLDEAELKRADIHEGIDSTIRILSRYFSVGNVDLVKDYGDLPQIEVFAAKLNQVWMNLLANAAQAIGTGDGVVRIETRSDEETVTVAISDTGCGIEQNELGRIFDPFFTTKSVGEGTGLGLSISFGIVEDHGGEIKVESEPGKGTTFTVVLPTKLRLPATNGSDTGRSNSHKYDEVLNELAI